MILLNFLDINEVINEIINILVDLEIDTNPKYNGNFILDTKIKYVQILDGILENA